MGRNRFIVNLDYDCTIYNNFTDLKKHEPDLAKKLLKQVKSGEWMENEIVVYPDDWEFTKYELSDGWYQDCNFTSGYEYKGAPNPLNYIDMDIFARDLIERWDDSCNIEIDGKIVTTGYGW